MQKKIKKLLTRCAAFLGEAIKKSFYLNQDLKLSDYNLLIIENQFVLHHFLKLAILGQNNTKYKKIAIPYNKMLT